MSPAGCTWAVWALKSRAGLRPASPSSPREEQYNLQTQGSARRGESSAHRKVHRGPVPVSRIPGAGAATARGADPGDAGPSELSKDSRRCDSLCTRGGGLEDEGWVWSPLPHCCRTPGGRGRSWGKRCWWLCSASSSAA